MALGETGISVTTVQRALGFGSNDVAALCKYTGINKWSRCKPFRSSIPFYATTADLVTALKASNFGFDFAGVAGSPINAASITNAFIVAHGSKGDWRYLPPDTVYRLGDFRLYNNIAPPNIYNFTVDMAIQGRLSINITKNEDSELEILDFADISNDRYNWKFGFVYQTINKPTLYSLGSSLIVDSQEVTSTLITADLGSTFGTYEYCAVLTKASIGAPNAATIFLPFSYGTYQYLEDDWVVWGNGYGTTPVISVRIVSAGVTLVKDVTVTFQLTNGTQTTYSGELTLTLFANSDKSEYGSTTDSYESLAPNGVITKSMTVTLQDPTAYEILPEPSTTCVQLKYTYHTSTGIVNVRYITLPKAFSTTTPTYQILNDIT